MTIKEIEELSGMTRANIRFYEAEGLLSPAREENGYRDYSEENLAILKRIKLLRSLHIPLEEIKAIQSGAVNLTTVLNRQLAQLTADRESLEKAWEICREMRDEGVLYETLDAQKYLDSMDQNGMQAAPELLSDQAPRAWVPWRRFFARMFDLAFYACLWTIFLLLVCHIKATDRSGAENLLDFAAGLLLMLFLEPLFLSLLRTTPGKWIFGLRVMDNDGRRLTYRKALARTWGVLVKTGFQLPIYSWIRMLQCYRIYDKLGTLSWEYDSEETVRDTKNWRCFAMTGAYLLLFFALFLSVLRAELPKHRGELTVAEFCENYDRYLWYYYGDTRYTLDSAGNWIEAREPGVYTITIGESQEMPQFSFVEKEGRITEVALKSRTVIPIKDEKSLLFYANQEEIMLSAMSFTLAQDGVDWTKKELKDLAEQLEAPFADFSLELYGVQLSCHYAFSGCAQEYDTVFSPKQGAEIAECEFLFTMKKTD